MAWSQTGTKPLSESMMSTGTQSVLTHFDWEPQEHISTLPPVTKMSTVGKIVDSGSHESLTLTHLEMHGCIVSIVATDALVLKHQAISIHSAD